MKAHEQHWFDRLATRRTRREALKAAFVGSGAMIGVSTLAPATAFADDPTACRVGCNWTAHQVFNSRQPLCAPAAAAATAVPVLAALSLGVVFWYDTVKSAQAASDAEYAGCVNGLLMFQKGAQYDCLQPGCSNFDPTQKGGPCDTCTGHCCVDPSVVTGYSCCAISCACSGDSGGCHGGASPC